jgi:8-oxo-dGTP diphosphatase
MDTKTDIYKAAGILIRDRKLLVERSTGKEFFIAPGGSIEAGETQTEALVRELMEEFQVTVAKADLEPFGEFDAVAAEQPGRIVHMAVFIVKQWQGEPTPDNEVEEILWLTSEIPAGIQVGSIFAHDVIPRLREQGLID